MLQAAFLRREGELTRDSEGQCFLRVKTEGRETETEAVWMRWGGQSKALILIYIEGTIKTDSQCFHNATDNKASKTVWAFGEISYMGLSERSRGNRGTHMRRTGLTWGKQSIPEVNWRDLLSRGTWAPLLTPRP
jgi:hypothetical protein